MTMKICYYAHSKTRVRISASMGSVVCLCKPTNASPPKPKLLHDCDLFISLSLYGKGIYRVKVMFVNRNGYFARCLDFITCLKYLHWL